MNVRFRSKFDRGSLDCAILKAYKAKDMQFFFQNLKSNLFKILKMFKYNMNFTREACWMNSKKKQQRQKHHTHGILILSLLLCWSLLWRNYWRSLMLWNSTSWSWLNLTVQLQLVLYPYDPFLINNWNMTANSVEKQYFVVLNVKLEVKLRCKMFYSL